MTRVGDKIRIARTEKKMTQKQLAKKVGVAEKFISDVEIGKKIASESVIEKISKILGAEIFDLGMNVEEDSDDVDFKEEMAKEERRVPKAKKKEINEVWDEAFGSNMKKIPVFGYDLKTAEDFRFIHMESNKIDGFQQDKVVCIKIEDNEMEDFRISKGDVAYCHMTAEIRENSICLIEVNGKRMIRKIRKLDSSKLLLISSDRSVHADTEEIKKVKVLLSLYKLEIKL